MEMMSVISLIWKPALWSLSKLIKPRPNLTFPIPRKTLVIVSGSGRPWWHMGSSKGQPAMQIAASFKVTNISRYNILLTSAQIKSPACKGHVFVRKWDSDIYGGYQIPSGVTTDMTMDFWIKPPIKKQGEPFKATLIVIDQFGNKHFIKKVDFKYS